MMESSNLRKGLIFALTASLVSGFSIFYNKQVVVSGIDPTLFNILKNGGVALILSVLLLLRKPLANRKESPSGRKTSFSKLVILGIVGGSIPFLLFFEGLRHVPAINANIIQKTLFIWVAILSVPLLSEKPKPVQAAGYLLILFSNFFLGGFSGFSFSIHEGMILLATLFWSVEFILARKILTAGNAAIAAWGRMFFGTLILLAYAAINGKYNGFPQITPAGLTAIGGSIILLTLYVTTFYKALKFAPATLVATVLILATPVTNILTSAFVTHNFPQTVVLSTIFLTLGVLAVALFTPGLANNGKYDKIQSGG